MRLQIDRHILSEALTRTTRVLVNRPPIVALAGLLCEATKTDGGKLNITAIGNNLTILTSVEANVQEEGTWLMPGKFAAQTVKSMPDGILELHINAEDGDTTAREMSISNGAEFTLRLFRTDDYPDVNIPDITDPVTVDSDTLRDAIKQVAIAASTDDARPILCGILFEPNGDTTRLIATDSYRLALREVDVAIQETSLLPAAGMKTVDQTISDDEINIYSTDNHTVFTSDRGSVIAQHISGSFPNYRQLIDDKDIPNTLTVDRDDLIDSIHRAALISEEHIPVKLEMSEGGVQISVNRTDIGSIDEHVAGTWAGEDDAVSIHFNARYLLDGVKAVGSDTIKIGVSDSFKPAILRPDGEDADDYLYMLMPVRV